MKKNSGLKKLAPYVWMLPSMILMAVMILVPIVTVFQMSMSQITKAGVIKGFNGGANFKAVFASNTFWHTLQNTLVWTVVVVGFSTVIGFIVAMVLNQNFRGRPRL